MREPGETLFAVILLSAAFGIAATVLRLGWAVARRIEAGTRLGPEPDATLGPRIGQLEHQLSLLQADLALLREQRQVVVESFASK